MRLNELAPFCLQLFQLLSYFQTSGSNEICSLLSIQLRCDRLLCPCAFATAFRAFLFCFTCPPRTDTTLPPLLLRPQAVRDLCTASIPTLLRRPPSHFQKKNQQRYVFVDPRTQRNTLATRHSKSQLQAWRLSRKLLLSQNGFGDEAKSVEIDIWSTSVSLPDLTEQLDATDEHLAR